MAKFDRKSQQLKARVQFVRGTVRKSKGSTLSDEDADTMTDKQIEDEIAFGTLEAVDREPAAEEPAAEGDGGGAGEAGGEAGAAEGEAAPKRRGR